MLPSHEISLNESPFLERYRQGQANLSILDGGTESEASVK